MPDTPSNSLEALVRTALLNGELAPGVAMQIERYQTALASSNEKRLLAILEDAITNGSITVISQTGGPTAIPARQGFSHSVRLTSRLIGQAQQL